MSSHEQRDDELDRLPPELGSRLAELNKVRVFVPPSVDETILNQARRHLAEVKPSRRSIILFNPWLAAAACIAVAALVASLLWRSTKHSSSPLAAREDVDGNGLVDICDAFALARKLQQGGVDAHFDVTGDGTVDQQDIDAIATEAVKLEKHRG